MTPKPAETGAVQSGVSAAAADTSLPRPRSRGSAAASARRPRSLGARAAGRLLTGGLAAATVLFSPSLRAAPASVAAAAARATPPSTAPTPAPVLRRELGDGYIYYRVHTVPHDLPTSDSSRRHPSVLDLRYASAGADAAAVLRSWLAFHATVRTPVFVLVNGATAPALLPPLEPRRDQPGLLVIGVATPGFQPDITVAESAAGEREAYDALEHGATVEALTTDNPDKERNDEASLARNFDSPAPDDDDDGGNVDQVQSPDDSSPDNAAPAHAKPPLIDAALQMALHLGQGLKILDRRHS